MAHPPLDLAPLGAAHFASIGDRTARPRRTERDVAVRQGEASLPQAAGRGAPDREMTRVDHCGAEARADMAREPPHRAGRRAD
ncbi:hypothetical protein [Streptomyces actuosus]|uniref:hypothetical protein n=1 Tax=Streptomyces actuosus TaxID=1885 RepID=UPI003F6827DE